MCRSHCNTVIAGANAGRYESQEMVTDSLAEQCGPVSINHRLWSCFMQASDGAQAKQQLHVTAIDGAKLQCCERAVTSTCKKLCKKSFHTDWSESFDIFEQRCRSEMYEKEQELITCLDEVEEPCQLGCQGLSYCSDFNHRPTELFRSCSTKSDGMARERYRLWNTGNIQLPWLADVLSIPVKHLDECHPHMWKAAVCALQLKPCHRKSHANRICRSDCIKILRSCLDYSRLKPGQTAAVFCDIISHTNDSLPCISLHKYAGNPDLLPGGIDSHASHLASNGYDSSFTSKFDQMWVQQNDANAMMLSSLPPRIVSPLHPCQPNPCAGESVMCVVNRECRATDSQSQCPRYKCVPGCRVGEMSDMLVGVGTFVRIRLVSQGSLTCQDYKVCYCGPGSEYLSSCENMSCMRSRPCDVDYITRAHEDQYYSGDDGCRKCICIDGETVCNYHSCPPALYTSNSPYTGLPCQADRHYVPVCGLRNGRTYVNKWVAECMNVSPVDHQYGPCNNVKACASHDCESGYKCVPRRQVCLSSNYLSCRQYICVPANCQLEAPISPVCDVLNRNFSNVCHLVLSGAIISHHSQCRHSCSSKSIVCGHDGETYGSECQAWAHGVAVDYPGACRAVGVGRFGQCVGVQCLPLPPYCGEGVTPVGACCPVCGGEITVLYSSHKADEAGRDTGSQPISVQDVVSHLRPLMMIGQCELFGYLNVEDEFVILVLPIRSFLSSHYSSPSSSPSSSSLIQVQACAAESERLENLIRRQNPLVTTDVILSVLTPATDLRLPAFGSSSSGSLITATLISLLLPSIGISLL